MISVEVLMTVYLVLGVGEVSACDWKLPIDLDRLLNNKGHSQLDDMWVAEQLQVLDLALDAAGHVAADKLLPRDDLEGDLLASAPVDSQLDLSKGTLA